MKVWVRGKENLWNGTEDKWSYVKAFSALLRRMLHALKLRLPNFYKVKLTGASYAI
eukprot:COSAG01_NODE_1843_length_9071_cov_527.289122_5_plen_56_part_00